MKKTLPTKQKQRLKAQAHHLNPVVIIGDKGLSENVQNEIDIALTAHELIKVKINSHDREERQSMANEIAQLQQAYLIQSIGRIQVFYRQNPEKN